MTDRRDLKRRVRERQARTGESYMTALRQVQAQRPGAIPMIELVDLTEQGAVLGFKCRIAMFPGIADRVDVAALLVRLRDALLATEGDRDFSLMRRVLLCGERARMVFSSMEWDAARQFVARVKAGIGGISESGRMLAMQVEGRSGALMAVFLLQLTPPLVPVSREPTLVITSPEAMGLDPILDAAQVSP